MGKGVRDLDWYAGQTEGLYLETHECVCACKPRECCVCDCTGPVPAQDDERDSAVCVYVLCESSVEYCLVQGSALSVAVSVFSVSVCVLCVSGAHAQHCYWLNLQRGKAAVSLGLGRHYGSTGTGLGSAGQDGGFPLPESWRRSSRSLHHLTKLTILSFKINLTMDQEIQVEMFL